MTFAQKYLPLKYLLGALAIAALVAGAALPAAQADDDDEDDSEVQRLTVRNEKWLAECGACHFAFPPRFLPAESWRVIMSGLDKHFGSDASTDAESVREITDFLEKHARRKSEPSGKAPLRITETRWFKHEHDDVSARAWKSSKVKSPANCTACHQQAELGDFSEHNVRIPR